MNRMTRNIILVILALTILVPIILLITRALSGTWLFPNLVPVFNFETFFEYISSDELLTPLKNSLILGITVTVFSLLLGIFPAKYLGTKDFKGKRLLEVLIMVPALTPGIAVVFGMRSAFISLGIYNTYWAIVLGQLTFALPYMIMTLSSVMKNYDLDYENQSQTLGVDKFNTLLFITIPSVKSGIAVGSMYTFIVSWSMYLFTSIYAPRGFTTLVTYLFPLFSTGLVSDQILAATSLVFFIPSLLFLFLSTKIMGSDSIYSRCDK